MGNVNVMLRYHDQESDELKYTQVEIDQHIKWAQFRQLAFGSFQDYLGDGVDPQFLTFETQLDTSNVQLTIPDGKTLRKLVSDFYRMEKSGSPAIIDVLVQGEADEERDDSSSDQSSEDEEDSEEVFEKLLKKNKYRLKVLEEYRDLFYAQFKADMFDEVKDKLYEENKEKLFEDHKEDLFSDFKDMLVQEKWVYIMREYRAQCRKLESQNY
eukprot:TRINITY_DN9828_c0_g1_i3.p1 TRINITY_DN9828_c0_g1~~TRINITY_DN9828_c0_g1_i3.p1  ORF type:complete len:230 (-),score=34.46 TRINITY_DN9828_c0_g1_i3:126-761(-)